MADELAYLDLLGRLVADGERRDGRNGATRSLFGERLSFDLKKGFPLFTTKRVFWRGVVEELLWFVRGSTDATELSAKGVKIWDGNTSRGFLDSVGLRDEPEGSIGAGYGFQWRSFGGAYPERDGGVDQLRYVVRELVDNPHGRRAILSAWNPKQLDMAALPPCHFAYQFYRGEKGLSCQLHMRSSDVCAGLPFNVASSALLTHLIARAIGESVDRLIVTIGDAHVYEPHVETALVQISREPFEPPSLSIRRRPPVGGVDAIVGWLETLCAEDVSVETYVYHPALKYDMIA
jgi:thymidylate synthase